MSKISFIEVENLCVYVHWKPFHNSQIHTPMHEIRRGKSGSIDVVCHHKVLDIPHIKKQVTYIIRNREKIYKFKKSKKNKLEK